MGRHPSPSASTIQPTSPMTICSPSLGSSAGGVAVGRLPGTPRRRLRRGAVVPGRSRPAHPTHTADHGADRRGAEAWADQPAFLNRTIRFRSCNEASAEPGRKTRGDCRQVYGVSCRISATVDDKLEGGDASRVATRWCLPPPRDRGTCMPGTPGSRHTGGAPHASDGPRRRSGGAPYDSTASLPMMNGDVGGRTYAVEQATDGSRR